MREEGHGTIGGTPDEGFQVDSQQEPSTEQEGTATSAEGGLQAPERKKSRWQTVGIVLCVLLSLGLLGGAYLYLVLPSRLPWGDDGVFTMLVIGTDVDYVGHATQAEVSVGRADTAMILVMPRRGGSATLISVPRDTLVKVNGNNGKVRFNSLYKGLPPDTMAEGIEVLTGLEVDRWVRVDFDAFVGFVDALGGIKVTVDKRMWYVDRAGSYSLDLKVGEHLLDGRTALAYVRYRQDALGDIARVARQQEFVQAIVKAVVKPSTVLKVGEFIGIFNKYVQNDMNTYEFAAIGMRMLKIGPANLDTRTLPGSFSGPYWEADEDAIAGLMEEIRSGGAK